MEKKYLNLYKILSIISGLVFIIFAFLMMYEEIISPEWKQYQDEYTGQMAGLGSPADQIPFRYGIRQIEVKPIDHIDRCITCHINIGQAPLDSFSVPYSDHPGIALEQHDLATFACTLCHNGSGRSLRRSETCERENRSKWRPLESRCAHCHLAVFDSTSVEASMPDISQGLMTFVQSGCLGCHKLRGVGGPFGPDLTSEGKKIVKAYNFKNIKGERSLYNWHNEHLSNPDLVSPGSIMPEFPFTPPVKNGLITLLLGLSEPSLPLHYYDLKVIKEFKDQRESISGEKAYQIFCSSCHEAKGKGRDYKSGKFGVPAISNPDFQAVASLDMISFAINEGRGGRHMPSWRSRHSGLRDSELIDLIIHVRQWREKSPSWEQIEAASFNTIEGENLYNQYCSTCHGKDRSGGIGLNLNNNSFLSLVTDQFLYLTLTKGRSNTAMPSWSRFEASSLKSLIRFLQPNRKSSKSRPLESEYSGNIDQGKLIFHYQCSRCHGSDGMGGIGPAILNRDFLEAAEDNFIIKTIKQGRSHTPMFKVEQSDSQLIDLLAFMRAQGALVPSYLNPGPSLGNPDLGKELFQQLCAECHGKMGEGVQAPALNNQEFLNAVTNGFLLATITLGRSGTPMPAWGFTDRLRHVLTTRERQNIVSYIRKWQNITIRRESSDPIYRLLNLTTENTEE
jgi:cytochrome c oxidase cbb3-type subunit 3